MLMRTHKRCLSHMPVMADEVVKILKPDHGKTFIDMTFGAGGHSKKILDTNKSITILAVDRDPLAHENAQKLAKEIALKAERLGIKQRVIPIFGKFSDVVNRLTLYGGQKDGIHGVIFDLGASSMQYDQAHRGFSISHDGPLDMRMDTTNSSRQPTAADVVNTLDAEELARIFKVYGEEKRSKKIASAIVDSRFMLRKIHTTKELADIVLSVSQSASTDGLGRFAHPATKVFQALRIFVNNELNELEYAITKMASYLVPQQRSQLKPEEDSRIDLTLGNAQNEGGKAIFITFHSLEDRIVKRHFAGVDINEPVVRRLSQHYRNRTNVIDNEEELRNLTEFKTWGPLFKHVVCPTTEEVAVNPRSRSAKLRAAVRL